MCLHLPIYKLYHLSKSPIISLVPRLFPTPVFDHLQYAKTEGEGLGEATCMTSGRD